MRQGFRYKTVPNPKQVPLGGRAVAWVKSEVLQWNMDRLAAARGQSGDTSPSK